MTHRFLFLCLVLLTSLLTSMNSSAEDSQDSKNVIKKGAYLARLGDCVACHTSRENEPMAGGVMFTTPFGKLYSTNITPDPETGIGKYTYQDFAKALREGITPDREHLYPAMPYTSFAKLTDEDMQALYSYFMKGVKPIHAREKQNQLRFPFNIRAGIAVWNQLFLDKGIYQDDNTQSSQWNRGAYLVQGLGHCGSCHTPRGYGMEEKTLSAMGDTGRFYLSGNTIENWHAVNLKNHWTSNQFAEFLKTGQNQYGTAYGTMSEVVHHSTQYLSDNDLAAVGEYLASLTPSSASSFPTTNKNDKKALYQTRGGLGYIQFCSACHQEDGQGVTHYFPTLKNNTSLLSDNPTSLIHVLLTGSYAPKTHTDDRGFAMPAFQQLTDKEIAEILTFIRTNWGNHGQGVREEDVATIRQQLPLTQPTTTRFHTPRFADMLDRPNSAQLIQGMSMMLHTAQQLPSHVGNDLNCTSCHLNAGTVEMAAPYIGLTSVFPSYRPRSGKIIDFKDRLNGCMQRSMNGKALDKNSVELNAMVAFIDAMKSPVAPKEVIPGRGIGKKMYSLIANEAHGKTVYQEKCAICHGKDGAGLKAKDGHYYFPPVWGKRSFNIGAGMSRTYTAAAFVKHDMPISNNMNFPLGQGGLSDQDAVDVAQYFTHQSRPDFAKKVKDWPNGGKPQDARY
ncbi:gluconate 2-dehydrogenase cytochrome c subunit precursor [Ferrovum sp. JA12]|nr:gluconate 2-dehydrogenase cytochrome c subunit precursor [Ferrovum sp. JA12]